MQPHVPTSRYTRTQPYPYAAGPAPAAASPQTAAASYGAYAATRTPRSPSPSGRPSRPQTRIYQPPQRSPYGTAATARTSRRGRHSARRRLFILVVALIVAAIACAPGISSMFGSFAGRLSGPLGSAAWTGGTSSTPSYAWRQGEVPYLYQTDEQWANEPYAGGTVAENGCGPTCLSMVYICLTGKNDLDPAGMASFSERNGYVANNMTAWTLMSEGASQLGLSSEELPADAGRVVGELEAGHPIICSVRPGDFTTTGHFIVLAGVAEDGSIQVHDPNSPERSAQPWDVQRILDQCSNLWAFSR